MAYHAFEFTTGLYYPSISSLKAEAIPEESRASVMTLLRIPMNVSIAIIFWNVSIYYQWPTEDELTLLFMCVLFRWRQSANQCCLLYVVWWLLLVLPWWWVNTNDRFRMIFIFVLFTLMFIVVYLLYRLFFFYRFIQINKICSFFFYHDLMYLPFFTYWHGVCWNREGHGGGGMWDVRQTGTRLLSGPGNLVVEVEILGSSWPKKEKTESGQREMTTATVFFTELLNSQSSPRQSLWYHYTHTVTE